MPLDLSDADLAGQLCRGRSVALQREGTVQRLLVAAPHTGERDFLQQKASPENGEKLLQFGSPFVIKFLADRM